MQISNLLPPPPYSLEGKAFRYQGIRACLAWLVVALWLVMSVLLVSCTDSLTSDRYTEAEKQALKSTIEQLMKGDSLSYHIEKYTQEEDAYALCLAYNALGRNFRNKASYAEALDAHNRSLHYAVLAVDTPEIIQAYNNLGTDYRRLGELKEASVHHYKALDYCEQYSDKESYGAVKNRVVSLNGIGNIHLSMGDRKVAERAFRRALAGETQLGSDLGRAINFANLGAIFEDCEQYDSARVYYTLSMECNRRAGSTLGISLCHDHFGRLHEVAERYDSALVEYGKAYTLMQGNRDSWHALKAALSIARVQLLQGQRDRALPFLQEAVEMAGATRSYGYMAEAHRMLAAYEEQGGNHRTALEHYKRSVAYNDSVYNEENSQQLRDSYVDYEKGQSMQQVEDMRMAYEAEVATKRMAFVMAVTIGVCAIVVIVLLWYVLRARQANIRVLQRMERMRTTFFTNITHEFRTPLTVILGMSDQLQQGCGDEEQRQYIESVQRQGKTLLNLVNQLLDITRLASGANEVDWYRGNIALYLKRTVDGYADYARLRKVNLTFHTQKEEVVACFVPEYVDKVMSNLLSNAFKYTPEEGHVTVMLEVDATHVVLRVADTGRGFPKDDLPHVFELFYQGSNNKEAGIVGTGVGLPFVKQMMEQMNGSVEAYNRKEGGAGVLLKLPLRPTAEIAGQCAEWRGELPDAAVPAAVPEATVPEEAAAERSVVLIVEDNGDVALYIAAQLRQRYEVYTAPNGYEALLLAEELRPDLIITDLMMPEMDGYELCNRVRNAELLCHIPIVVVSARGGDDDRLRALENGADAYLQKPFNAEELTLWVAKLIEQRKMLQERFARMMGGSMEADVALTEEDRKLLTRLNALVWDNMGNHEFGVEALAEKLYMSSSKLYRRIRALTGYSTSAYILRLRMERAKELLGTTNHAVSDVALRCGFDDTSYFTRTFRNFYGCTPSQMRLRVVKG